MAARDGPAFAALDDIRVIRALVLCLWATPALAEPLDAATFAAYVTGRTLIFAAPDGTVAGAESYGPDHSVTWQAATGQCQQGRWSAQGGQICFVYQGDPQPTCWTVSRTASGLRAVSPSGTILTEVEAADTPLTCHAPDLLS